MELRRQSPIEIFLLDNHLEETLMLSLHHLEEFFLETPDMLDRNPIEIATCPLQDASNLLLNGYWHELSLLEEFDEARTTREECLSRFVGVRTESSEGL